MARRAKAVVGLIFLGAAPSSCSRRVEPPAETRSAAPVESAKPGGASAPSAPAPAMREITWTDPAGWQKVASPSAMRKATYHVPSAPKDSDDGEMAVFYFRGEGGSTEANIQRWISQFSGVNPSDVKRSQRTVRGMNQTIVEVEGTYASGMPGAPATPKAHYRLLGAVVETPAGPYFFKLTGPTKTVDAARDAYMMMLDSVRSS